jgi:hypothetical protein
MNPCELGAGDAPDAGDTAPFQDDEDSQRFV